MEQNAQKWLGDQSDLLIISSQYRCSLIQQKKAWRDCSPQDQSACRAYQLWRQEAQTFFEDGNLNLNVNILEVSDWKQLNVGASAQP